MQCKLVCVGEYQIELNQVRMPSAGISRPFVEPNALLPVADFEIGYAIQKHAFHDGRITDRVWPQPGLADQLPVFEPN